MMNQPEPRIAANIWNANDADPRGHQERHEEEQDGAHADGDGGPRPRHLVLGNRRRRRRRGGFRARPGRHRRRHRLDIPPELRQIEGRPGRAALDLHQDLRRHEQIGTTVAGDVAPRTAWPDRPRRRRGRGAASTPRSMASGARAPAASRTRSAGPAGWPAVRPAAGRRVRRARQSRPAPARAAASAAAASSARDRRARRRRSGPP